LTPLFFNGIFNWWYEKIMTVKLAVLKSGEDIISDMQEMVIKQDEEEKVIGYIFKRPCVVKLENKQNLSDLQGNRSFEIGMFPWIPLSADQDVPVSADWVITLVEPIEKLKVMYEKGVLNNGQADKTFSDDEQPDSDIGD
jgi:hypothetical protein